MPERRGVTTLLLALSLASLLPPAGCHRQTNQCGVDIPADRLWLERTEAELEAAIGAASACARTRGTRVLLEFIAPWCTDCHEMTRIERLPPVARVLRERYERVRVNVGQWDRHLALRNRFHIDRIAAYVVLDPNTGQPVAQTLLEPVTGGRPITPELWIAWLRAPHD